MVKVQVLIPHYPHGGKSWTANIQRSYERSDPVLPLIPPFLLSLVIGRTRLLKVCVKGEFQERAEEGGGGRRQAISFARYTVTAGIGYKFFRSFILLIL